MKTLSSLLLVSLSIGVAAPVAARPSVAALPGVSDVLLNLNVAAPVSAGPRAVPLNAWLGLTDLPVAALSPKRAMWCADFTLLRLVAEFAYFDGETSTTQGVPGIPIYQKMVEVPDGCDTLYITFHATADEDVGEWFTCKVDFAFCNPGSAFGTGGGAGTPGWISLQHLLGEQIDNNISYSWCVQTTPGTHAVELRMASEVDGTFSFLETAHFYIDASNTNGGCVQAGPVEDPFNPHSLLPPKSLLPPQSPLPPLPKLP
ncbi:MAG TPA: hypothetical protein VEL29_06480 [Gemmatimonadales bacterium]|nr:hypothetical protein [Gemmatimonadales bacterium]